MGTIGWIYALTCSMYDRDGIIKLGYVEKPNMIEDEVKTSLLQRYGTTLVDPRVLLLYHVSNPKQAEKELFILLIEHKLKNEIFKIGIDIITPVFIQLQQKYNPNVPYMIAEPLLEKLLVKMKKKAKRIARDLQLQQNISNWIYSNSNMLSNVNRNNISYFTNNMPNPSTIGSHFDWTKKPENQNALNMRILCVNSTFQINNWDKTDIKLHEFLKRLCEIA